MTQKVTLRVKIDKDIKKLAEEKLEKMGLKAGEAIELLYRQIIFQDKLPFEIMGPRVYIPPQAINFTQ